MIALLDWLKHRLIAGVGTWPTPAGWGMTGLLLLATVPMLGAYGFKSGFLTSAPPIPPAARYRIWASVWFAPALIEEVLFRVLPLPHSTETVPKLSIGLAAAAALVVFVLAHPLRTWVKPTRKNAVFTDRHFLTLATLLGTVCSAAYLVTGSIWPPVLLHYLLVGSWLTRCGGWQKIAA